MLRPNEVMSVAEVETEFTSSKETTEARPVVEVETELALSPFLESVARSTSSAVSRTNGAELCFVLCSWLICRCQALVNPFFSHTTSIFPAWSAPATKSFLTSPKSGSGRSLIKSAFVSSPPSEKGDVRSLVGLGEALLREPGNLYGFSPCVSLFHVNLPSPQ
jgi:hypothetical protein